LDYLLSIFLIQENSFSLLLLAGTLLQAAVAPPISVTSSPPGAKVMELAGYCRLMEDLLELGTIQDCQDVFTCMERDAPWIIHILSSETKAAEAAASAAAAAAASASGQASSVIKPTAAAGSHPAQLAILRSCNGLLRRLSKVRTSTYTV
jgi:hypothetical protein